MYDYLTEYFNAIRNYWSNKKYAKAVAFSLVFGLAMLLLGFCLAYFILVFLNFISVHFDAILTIAGLTLIVIYFINQHYTDKSKLREQQAEEKRFAQQQIQNQQELVDERILTQNYNLLRRVLFQTLPPICDVLKLKTPHDISDLENPNHYIRRGNVILYQYAVVKNATTVEPDIIKNSLQELITRKLLTQSYSGIGQDSYLFEGKTYPIIMIDSIEETHAYIIINIVITDKYYTEYLTQHVSSNLLQQATQLHNVYDKDF